MVRAVRSEASGITRVNGKSKVKGSGQECPLHTNCHPEIGECPVCMVRLGIPVNGKES